MKSSLLYYIFYIMLILPCVSLSQSANIGADKSISYDSKKMTNEFVKIPLHKIELDNVEIPIFLSYDSKGFRPSELPNSVGFGWKLNAGGEINKTIMHLVDETKDGWFFDKDYSSIGTGSLPGYDKYNDIDISPDIFNIDISNGSQATFFMKKNINGQNIDLTPIVFNNSSNIKDIYLNKNKLKQSTYDPCWSASFSSENQSDLGVYTKKGLIYQFRRGLKRQRPWDINHRNETKSDSAEYKNYYLHRVWSIKNNDEISFKYINTRLYKIIPHGRGVRKKTNSDPRTPPESTDPIVTRELYEDTSIEDNSRKEIKEIISNNQKILFKYKKHSYYTQYLNINSNFDVIDYKDQRINLLDEILIFDHKGNYVYGYKFEYTKNPQALTQSESTSYEGQLKLKRILKFGKNKKSFTVFREFNYFNGHISSHAGKYITDALGFYNGVEQGITDAQSLLPDRYPDFSEMRSGMLKSVTNENGGGVEYEYSLNRYGDMYFGGLLINAVNGYNENQELVSRKEYTYENPEGFGLPIYSQDSCYDSNFTYEEYSEGYLECTQMNHLIWKSYFTKYKSSSQYFDKYKFSYHYYDLYRHTPILDSLTSDYQDFNQIEFGSFYSKVTESKINVENNTQEKGHVVKHYIPSVEGFKLNKRLSKIEIYNNSNTLIKESVFNYEYRHLEYFYLKKFDNYHTVSSLNYHTENDYFHNIKEFLRSKEIKDYDLDGNHLKTNTRIFHYYNESNQTLDPDFQKIDYVIEKINGEESNKKEYTYFKDYNISDLNNPSDYQYLDYLNPIVENRNWIKSNNGQWLLKKSTVNSYDTSGRLIEQGVIDGKNENIIYNESNYVGTYIDSNTGNFVIPTDNKFKFSYNNEGKLISMINQKTSDAYLYNRTSDHDGLYVDVILKSKSNFDDNTYYKTSFENYDTAQVSKHNSAFSGEYVYTGNPIVLNEFPSGHIISYWAYNNLIGKWKYIKHIHNGGDVVVTIPNGYDAIDELRIQPPNTLMQTYTIKPLIGVTSKLNDSGFGERVKYDVFNNPLYFRDKDGNIIKENQSKTTSTNY